MSTENKNSINQSEPGASWLPKWLKVSLDGVVTDGRHRLLIMLQSNSELPKPSDFAPFRNERIPTLNTESMNQSDYEELVDFSVYIGQYCWDVYRHSKIGAVRLYLLPDDTVRRRAAELFQLAFSAAMLMGPPPEDSDETTRCEFIWKDYLDKHKGQIVLDGPAYPETPEIVLQWAKVFFSEGFRAGSLAVRELLNS